MKRRRSGNIHRSLAGLWRPAMDLLSSGSGEETHALLNFVVWQALVAKATVDFEVTNDFAAFAKLFDDPIRRAPTG